MTVPSNLDIKKREEKLKKFLSKLDENGKPREKDVVSVVRSAIRSAWMKSDVKLAYLYMNTEPDMDDTTRTKWKVKCEKCGEYFKLNEVEIDHRFGNHSFTKPEDFSNYFENILMVGFDDLSILCKEDHAVKTYMEKNKCSWGEAVAEKKAIEICKSKQDKQWLIDRGITPASSQAKRREQITNVLKEEIK